VSGDLAAKVVIGEEDRNVTDDPSVGRLRKERKGNYLFCTATLVSRSCALTAGHCSIVFEVLEFDLEVVPNRFRFGSPENVFVVDRSRVIKSSNGKGDDWAVLPLKPNRKTGRYPGDDRPIVPLASRQPLASDVVFVTGYGAAENEFSFSQQSSEGKISRVVTGVGVGPYLEHDVDTGNSSSGSPLRSVESGEILGIHTHGDSARMVNSGSIVPGNVALVQALEACDSIE
jgi:V8-like Glu-specific endopeptidase